jgi:phospholipase/carboxylesterase
MLTRAQRIAFVAILTSAAVLSCRPPSPLPPQGTLLGAPLLRTILMFPERFDTSRTTTLLVALHGYGGTAGTFALVFASLPRMSLFVAVPDGEYPAEGGGHSWFHLVRDRRLWESYDAHSAQRVVELIADLRTRYRIANVFVLGFSQGATLAYMVGLRNPTLVSGVLAISGGLPKIDGEGSIVRSADVTAARGLKLFVARGASDPLVSEQTFTTQWDYFTLLGYAVTSYEFAGAHTLTPELLDRVLRWIQEQDRR